MPVPLIYGLISLIISLVLKVVSYLLRPKPKPPQGAEPGTMEGKIPVASEGNEVAVVFGLRWIMAPTVVWYGDMHTEPIEKSAGGGGGKK